MLTAPFAGVVTARYADPGALVTNASSNQTAALPLVTISDTSKLKVTVYAEQSEAPNVKPGLEAEIIDAANPQRKVKGTVTRVSGELDSRTRTLLTEVDFDNSQGQFVAGSFVNVNLLIPAVSYVEVPAPALVSRDKKTMLAVVTPEKTIRLQPVEVAGTDGKVLRVASGLNEGERVALSLPPSVNDGGHINPVPVPGVPAPAAVPPAPPTPPPAKQAAAPEPQRKPVAAKPQSERAAAGRVTPREPKPATAQRGKASTTAEPPPVTTPETPRASSPPPARTEQPRATPKPQPGEV
jgi:hypothetical protein